MIAYKASYVALGDYIHIAMHGMHMVILRDAGGKGIDIGYI